MDGVSEFLVEEMIHVAQFVSQFSSVAQSCLTLCDPMNRACQACLSITNCWSLPKPMISGYSAFSETSLNIWNFMIHILLKPGLENFEHYFTSL